ncbi:MAG: monovalent cation/H+ antiporter complex subunit F [Pseudochelatococcus sp.]|uniref:monovalent cation/H+ antiporter complex subunit F n=1 Tax=Pseudochelatococcus sp. TaxID=2020869 RepID=UPI003D93C820
MADIPSTLSGLLIFSGAVLALARLVIGRTIIDRAAAVAVLTATAIAAIAFYAHLSGRFVYLDVALVCGLFGFLLVPAIARHLERGM